MKAENIRVLDTVEGLKVARYRPLWYHTAGASQTRSGYGSALTLPWMVPVAGKLRRVYATCWGNSGTAWIVLRGRREVVRDY